MARHCAGRSGCRRSSWREWSTRRKRSRAGGWHAAEAGSGLGWVLGAQRLGDPLQQIRRRVEPAQLLLHFLHETRFELVFRGTSLALGEMILDQPDLVLGQLPVDVVLEPPEELFAVEAVACSHFFFSPVTSLTMPSSRAMFHSAFCSMRRPRCSRERTVPTGRSRTAAISL